MNEKDDTFLTFTDQNKLQFTEYTSFVLLGCDIVSFFFFSFSNHNYMYIKKFHFKDIFSH